MIKHVLVGFGFGPIQSGFFVPQAHHSGNFSQIVIAEVDQLLVDKVRANNGTYYYNVAGENGIETKKIDGVEILNPKVASDREILKDALTEATEIVTALPSVAIFSAGDNDSIASLIAHGLQNSKAPQTLIYTAENNNHAAEILEEEVNKNMPDSPGHPVGYLNTVIGKMSQVITVPEKIIELNIKVFAPDADRAFLVEEFDRILVTRNRLPGVKAGLDTLIEKDEILPFEEVKLYGHNAIHALIGYLGALQGYQFMSELRHDKKIMAIARNAFLNESGAALIKKYAYLDDELFTPDGFTQYADNLLTRMTNPYLDDTTERAGRDPIRKLTLDDRIFGTMTMALDYKIQPENMALAAAGAVAFLVNRAKEYKLPDDLRGDDWQQMDMATVDKLLTWIWQSPQGAFHDQLVKQVHDAIKRLPDIIDKTPPSIQIHWD